MGRKERIGKREMWGKGKILAVGRKERIGKIEVGRKGN